MIDLHDTAPIPTLRPPESPQALRAAMVEDYTAMAQRAGHSPERAAVERVVLHDLQIAEAVEREAMPPLPPSVDTLAGQRSTRQEKADAAAAKVGAEIQRSGGVQVVRRPSRALHAVPRPGTRWSNAVARAGRLMAGATGHSDPVIATSTCESPKLALKLMRIYAHVAALRWRDGRRYAPPRPGCEPNPFHGLTPSDFAAKLQAMVGEVCDESTGIPGLGPWFVPK